MFFDCIIFVCKQKGDSVGIATTISDILFPQSGIIFNTPSLGKKENNFSDAK